MRHWTRLVLAATAGLWMAGPALAQVDTSKETIPFLTGAAAEMAAKMLAICGGLSGQSSVTVTVRKAPPASPVTLVVGGIPQATVVTTTGGSAKFRFSTTPTATRLPLDFDPRGRIVEIEDAAGTALVTTDTGTGENPPRSKVDERVNLTPTGIVPAASGHARLRERNGVRDFDVEVEDVPDGGYDLIVDGVVRGTITVTLGRGSIEFSTGGDDPDELPLTFDPLRALVQVAQGSDVVLTGTMLADAPGVSVCTPSETTSALSNAGGADPDANGDVRFRIRDDCDRDFQVEAEDVPVGVYDVFVGGVLRGTTTVVDVGMGDTEGEIEFDTDPDEPGEVLLDFDPTGQTVEVRQGGVLYLSTTVGAPNPGECSVVDVEPDMTNTGADPDADGKARFRQELDCDTDFRVEADDLAVGDYEIVVASIVRGTMTVVDIGGGDTEGSLDFQSEPNDPGEVLLDFDPRGQLVEVRQGATTYLTVTMPN